MRAIPFSRPKIIIALQALGDELTRRGVLLEKCRITDASDALALLARLYPQQEPPVKTRLFLEELLGPITHRELDER